MSGTRMTGLRAVSVGLASLAAFTGHARAQDQRGERAGFVRMVDAAEALARLEPQPADANGALWRWDRRWRARLDQLVRRSPLMRRRCFSPTSCLDRGVCALTPVDTAVQILAARDQMLGDLRPHALAVLAEQLASRRLVADEASRRRREGLSCEDLPSSLHIAAGQAGEVADASRPFFESEDVEALLAVARGGTAALEELLRRRAAVAEAERRDGMHAAAMVCEQRERLDAMLLPVVEALRSGVVRRDRDLHQRALAAAGFDDHGPEPTRADGSPDWPARAERRQRTGDAWNRLSRGDPEVARAFIAQIREHAGDEAPELLVALVGRTYNTIDLADARALIACIRNDAHAASASR